MAKRSERFKYRLDRQAEKSRNKQTMDSCRSTDAEGSDELRSVETSQSKNTILVAAIDLGTTYSGYAFSFKHEYDANPLTINTNVWENTSGGGVRHKTPTCLLLTKDKKLHSFGYEAIQKYEHLTEQGNHNDWYFFWQFKMSLHQTKEIRGDYILKEEHGKTLKAMVVFSLSIQYLKDHLITTIRNASPDMKDRDITWVITVPAIWKESAKKFMRKAAEKAGIDRDRLEVALEPEAASILCRLLPITRDPQVAHGLTKFPPGTRYMILDCGGGTVDVTVHEVLADNTLKEIHVATGGDWGGMQVNKAFLNFLSNLVGPEVFQKFSEENKHDYLSIQEEFENKKRAQKPDSSDSVAIRIPIALQHVFQKPEGKASFTARMKEKVSFVGDKIRINAKQFTAFFDVAIREILRHVEELLEILPGPIKAILMVGGFAESPILQKAVRDKFGGSREVIIPIEASLCVVKGAVLYGHDPLKVSSRKCPCTYGILMTSPFQKSHPVTKKITIDGEDFCDDLFDKHVEIGQEIRTGESTKEKIYYPLTVNDRYLPVVLYKSMYKDPKFVDDRGCECVGKFMVILPERKIRKGKKRAIHVRMVFGGTDVTVIAREDDGSIHKADFTFNA